MDVSGFVVEGSRASDFPGKAIHDKPEIIEQKSESSETEYIWLLSIGCCLLYFKISMQEAGMGGIITWKAKLARLALTIRDIIRGLHLHR